MAVDDETVRLAVYTAFATTGRAPATDKLAAELDLLPAEITESLRRLAEERHVVLGVDDEIVMAHPFAAIPLGFAVMGTRTLWWGGCAWDSFALPHLLPDEPEVLVATRCPGCDAALAWVVGRDAPPTGNEVAHFLVPVAHMWDDVVHTCGNQRLFCGEQCVQDWLDRTGNTRGYVMDLTTLWRLAQHWYDGRLARGYVRREPTSAREYLREVGLSGPFWGLD
ncbi:MAG: hypothetical protein QOG53_259 [Frankiales bacterium]|nr:hypothetical protein [Frankiales bacterium]